MVRSVLHKSSEYRISEDAAIWGIYQTMDLECCLQGYFLHTGDIKSDLQQIRFNIVTKTFKTLQICKYTLMVAVQDRGFIFQHQKCYGSKTFFSKIFTKYFIPIGS